MNSKDIYGDETKASQVQRNLPKCPPFEVCVKWAKYQKIASLLWLICLLT